MERRARIWDRPTRVFHWCLVALFAVCYFSGEERRFDIHIPAAQALLILVIARVAWGFAGSESARFRSFLKPPGAIAAYIRTWKDRRPVRTGGHNPLGGLSVLLMLAALLVQAGTGLFAADIDGLNEGPLSFAVGYEAARDASAVHLFTVNVLLALVALHVAAVVAHLVYKRENLIGPMVSGRAPLGPGLKPPRLVPEWRAIVILAASAAAVIGTIELSRLLL